MFLGKDEFVWWMGVVEDNYDPALLGRLKVRIFGYHPPKFTNSIDTEDLPYAWSIQPANMQSAYGRINKGEWVIGFFLDGHDAQEPVVIGYLPGNTQTKLGGIVDKYSEETGASFPKVFISETDTNRNGFYHSLEGRTVMMMDPGVGDIDRTAGSTQNHLGKVAVGVIRGDITTGFYVDSTDSQTITGIRDEKGAVISITTNVGDSHSDVSVEAAGVAGKMTLKSGEDSDIYVTGKGGTFALTQALKSVNATTSARLDGHEARIKKIEYPPPPPTPRVRGGGDCFTADTMVIMSNMKEKPISEIEVGDFVFGHNGSKYNEVLFVEKVVDTHWSHLYSPDVEIKPFITINHPTYIDDELYACIPEETMKMYPWLGHIKQHRISTSGIEKTTGQTVYNLWVAGDGTYVVNRIPTTCIMVDGGLLVKAFEHGFMTDTQVMALVDEFTSLGDTLQHGAYLLNSLIGRCNDIWLYEQISKILTGDKKRLLRRGLIVLMRILSKLEK
jgi:hypothetical protein